MPSETVMVGGRKHDKLTCDQCKREFLRPAKGDTSKVVVKVYCSVACSRKSDVRLGGTGAKPTVSNLIGTTSQVGYAQPLTCSTGYCSCAAKDRRMAALEAAMNPQDIADVDAALAGKVVSRG